MKRNKLRPAIWKWSAAAVCLCLAAGAIFLPKLTRDSEVPQPKPAQVVNPMVTVSSREEMEQMLDFAVPVLEKPVEKYIVLVFDGIPTMGRLYYEDGAVFSVQYGSGDISGIYGGTLQSTGAAEGVAVSYYQYETTRYALWERDGFTYSLTGGDRLEQEVAALLAAAE